MTEPSAARIKWLHATLEHAYGGGQLAQRWGVTHGWPAGSRFEILAGAVLTQNTAWRNVERAIANLDVNDWLSAEAMLAAPQDELAAAIRPAGYYRKKARYLKNVCVWLAAGGGFQALGDASTETLRRSLLRVAGIGPETADTILLYAFGRPVFVVDAYTRRLLERLGWPGTQLTDTGLRHAFEAALPGDAGSLGELHALIVTHAKAVCRARPLCEDCLLLRDCVFGRLRNQHSARILSEYVT